MDEARFLADFHQTIGKEREKSWHVQHIEKKLFAVGDKVLLYDNKFLKHPGKLQMHWLGPFIFAEVREFGAVKLAQVDGILLLGWVNNAHLKLFHDPIIS